ERLSYSRPTVKERLVARLRAEVSGRYLSLAIASSTCWRVDSCTFGSSLMTRETVLREVPATRATSLMLARFIEVFVDQFQCVFQGSSNFCSSSRNCEAISGTQRLCTSASPAKVTGSRLSPG